jgi:hypothetical protein
MFQQSLFVLTFLWMVSSIGAFMTPMQHLPTTLSSCSELHAATKSDGPETFKKADLVNIVSGKTGLTKVQTEAALQAMLTTIQEQVALDRKVTLPGFGIFTLRERSARKGRYECCDVTLERICL